jgi:beta-lactamase regulating signal transducer with metallopeptidase domain
MADLILSRSSTFLIGDLLWQSGLVLIAGLAASLALSRRPARAHLVLLLAIMLTLFTPLFGQFVRSAGWGLWTAGGRGASTLLAPPSQPALTSSAMQSTGGPGALSVLEGLSAQGRGSRRGAWRDEIRDDGMLLGPLDRRNLLIFIPQRFLNTFLSVWFILSGLSVARLIVSWVIGRRIVGRARRTADESIDQAAQAACTRLALRVQTELLTSSRVTGPAIWCWGRRPRIVLPEYLETKVATIDWVAVFCHELAHWCRRDQWSSLLAEVLVCALPWHPLAWWARHRLEALSELACDGWVLATGLSATDYAESLLSLVPRRRRALVLPAVSTRRGLFRRIKHILDDRPISPFVGRRWACLSAGAMTLLGSTLALAQGREIPVRSHESNNTSGIAQRPPPQPSPREHGTHRMIRGSVRDATARPVAGASVFAVRGRVLAQAICDQNGGFTLELALDPAVMSVDIFAKAAGMGLTGRNYSIRPDALGKTPFEVLSDQRLDLTLGPNVPIEGRLISPAGTAASGVSVNMMSLSFGEKFKPGWVYLSAAGDDDHPSRAPYWPEPAVTDSQGRFRIDGFSEKAQSEIRIVHNEYVHESLTISTAKDLSEWHKKWEIKPVAPRFTHVLEPARAIEGVVTDRDTGKPIAGVNLELYVARAPDWRFHFPTKTDTNGRYRIIGIAWNHAGELPGDLAANVIPATTSNYLPVQEFHHAWPAGTKELRWDFTLKKVPLKAGRVTERKS